MDVQMSEAMEASNSFPLMPGKLEEAGLNVKFMSSLLAKSVYLLGLETNVQIAAYLKLGQSVVDDLLSKLKQQGFIEVLGTVGSESLIGRFSLTTAGKNLAIESSRQCEYVGPAPVPLVQYQAQVHKQRLGNEKISIEDIGACLSHLILPPHILRKLGPAINSGRSLLIYGPPGNGKTSISEAIGKVFRQPIFIPHCIEVDGQVIRILDHTVHSEYPQAEGGEQSQQPSQEAPRSPVGSMPAPGCDYGRGAYSRNAGSAVRCNGKVLRGASANESRWRSFYYRRFWPSAGETPRFAQPLDHSPREKSGLSDDPYRQEI